MVGVDPQRRLVLTDRLIGAALLSIDHAQVVVRCRIRLGLIRSAAWYSRIASSVRPCCP